MVVIHFQFHVKLESLKMKSVEIKSTAAQPPCSALFGLGLALLPYCSADVVA